MAWVNHMVMSFVVNAMGREGEGAAVTNDWSKSTLRGGSGRGSSY